MSVDDLIYNKTFPPNQQVDTYARAYVEVTETWIISEETLAEFMDRAGSSFPSIHTPDFHNEVMVDDDSNVRLEDIRSEPRTKISQRDRKSQFEC